MRILGYPDVVDEVTVRLVAAVVLIVGIVGLVTGQWWWYAALAVDFLARVAAGPALSPIARGVLRWVRPRVPVGPRPTPGPPKRFAAGIGAVLTTAATATAVVAGLTGSASAATATFALGALMVVFPALEAAAGICVGCVVFARLMKAGLVPERVCLACSDLSRRGASTARA